MLRTVLIADEDAAFRKYLAMPLAAQGFTIYEAADGSAAWQLAVQNRPWMILADISHARGGRLRVLPPRAQPPAALAHAAALHLGLGQVQGALPRAADRRRRLPLEEHADPRAADAHPAAHDAVLRPLRVRRAEAGRDRGRRRLPGPHRGVRRAGAPADVQPGPAHRARSPRSRRTPRTRPRSWASARATSSPPPRATRSGPTASTRSSAWEKGSFKFTPGDPGPGEPLAQSVEHLLLEGCRLLDESRKDEGDEGRRLSARAEADGARPARRVRG